MPAVSLMVSPLATAPAVVLNARPMVLNGVPEKAAPDMTDAVVLESLPLVGETYQSLAAMPV